MAILPSLGEVLVKKFTQGGKNFTMFYRSGRGPNNFKYSISLFQDNATGKFVNGSYKSVQVKNGCRTAWRQDLMNSEGYGNRTYRFDRVPAEEAKKHMVTPDITLTYFKDPVYNGTVQRLFPDFFVQRHQGYGFVGKNAVRDIKANPQYNRDVDRVLAQIEENCARRKAEYDPWG